VRSRSRRGGGEPGRMNHLVGRYTSMIRNAAKGCLNNGDVGDVVQTACHLFGKSGRCPGG